MPLVNIFQRSNSVAGTPVYPSSIANAANQRRLSLTTQVGLAGTSPTSANLARRASLSTNSSDYDENVIEEEDFTPSSRTAPVTPFTARRVSFGTAAGMRRPGGTSPGTSNGRLTSHSSVHAASPLLEECRGTNPVPRTPRDSAAFASASVKPEKPQSSNTTQTQSMPSNISVPRSRPRATSDLFTATRPDQGFNWSEQLRSRAESTVAGSRPSFSFASGLTGSPPRPGAVPPPGGHDRTKSVSDMPAPPAQAPKPRSPPRDTRPKPDHFQERILKGDFYMD